MAIRLYNTLSRQKDVLVPGDPKRVTMYVCGPTVYSRAHIGNARPAVVFDVLRRLLRHEYGAEHVVYARNITDIDDRIIAQAAADAVPIEVITRRTEDWYLADMGALGVEPPDFAPHATTSVPAMVAMMEVLVAKGHAYAADGHVLFDVPSFAGYGALSRRPLDEMIAGARVEVAPYKKSPADFVLWKPSTDAQPGWESPWGRGRPGWHIECSAMIAEALGTTIDIHGGGQDLQFPHHENELAQSTCAHDGAPLARIWMHNGFLNMGSAEKMSKSLGNVMGVDELLREGYRGEVLRSALLFAHYRSPLQWTPSLLTEVREKLDYFYSATKILKFRAVGTVSPDFIAALSNDLAFPEAWAVLTSLAKSVFAFQRRAMEHYGAGNWEAGESARNSARKYASYLLGSGRMFGIFQYTQERWSQGELYFGQADSNALNIEKLISERNAARAARNFGESDRIRDELAAEGIVLEDGPGGTTWRRA